MESLSEFQLEPLMECQTVRLMVLHSENLSVLYSVPCLVPSSDLPTVHWLDNWSGTLLVRYLELSSVTQ